MEERIGAVSDMSALVRAGRIPYAEALALCPKLATDKNRFVVEAAINLVAGLRDSQLVPKAQIPAYAHFIRQVFGPQAHKLGWVPRPGEDEDTRLLRNVLLPLVSDQGEDSQLNAQAKQLAAAWLKTRKGVDPEVVQDVLELAAKDGNRALFETLHQQASKEPDRLVRHQILAALGSFGDRELTRAAMDLTLGNEFELREAMPVIWRATIRPATQPVAYEFVKHNFDTLVGKLPRDAGAFLPFIGVPLCDEGSRADLEAFFKDRSGRFTGGPRMLSQALERMKLCIAFRKAQTPSIADFFSHAPK